MYKFLQGVTVIELGHILLAPFATQSLGDFGAEVIKIEALGGDIYRFSGASQTSGMSPQWMSTNRNKKSVSLNLKTEKGKEILKKLISEADIFVHNMRANVIDRLGFDYSSVREMNPGIVYCVANGYGQDGPYADYPAIDDVIQARCGLALLDRENGGEPKFLPMAIADLMTGSILSQAMLAGYSRKQMLGTGCYLEVPMFETMVNFVLNQHLNGHAFVPPSGDIGYGRVLSPYRKPAPTKDGFIAHGIYSFRHWVSFMTEAERRDILDGPLMGDRITVASNIETLYKIVHDEIFPDRTTEEWLAILTDLDIPCSPVVDLKDLESDPHLQTVGLFEDYDHPTQGRVRQVRIPISAIGVETSKDNPPPNLGAHTYEVMLNLGYKAVEIMELSDSGVLNVASSKKTDTDNVI